MSGLFSMRTLLVAFSLVGLLVPEAAALQVEDVNGVLPEGGNGERMTTAVEIAVLQRIEVPSNGQWTCQWSVAVVGRLAIPVAVVGLI